MVWTRLLGLGLLFSLQRFRRFFGLGLFFGGFWFFHALAALFSPGFGRSRFHHGRNDRGQAFHAHLQGALDFRVQMQSHFVFAQRADGLFKMDFLFVERDVELVLHLVGN